MSPRSRFLALVALCAARAREGLLVKASLVLGGVLALAAAVVAAMTALHSHDPAAVARLPAGAAALLAWAAGVLVAFAASSRALVRDEEQGIRALAASHGATPTGYVVGRALGLAAVLFVLVGGGAVLTAFAEALAAREGLLALAQGTFAALAFALMFSLSVAPLSLAALGARSRAGGYLALVVVLVVPELLEGYAGRILPGSWGELIAVPSALTAVASGLCPGTGDAAQVVRAVVVLAGVAVLSMLVARAQLGRAKELAA
jgi:hypothetical protein